MPENKLPATIAGTQQRIGDELLLSIKTDRTWVLGLARNTTIIFSPQEAREIWLYLARFHYHFTVRRSNQ